MSQGASRGPGSLGKRVTSPRRTKRSPSDRRPGGSGAGDVQSLHSGVTTGFVAAAADPTIASFVLLLIALLIAAAAFVLWLDEFAERFALGHMAIDDKLWSRLHAVSSDAELAALTICCGAFLGMSRTLAVVGVRAPAERILV